MSIKTEWKDRVKRCDTYVMCSTLNQMVNYLPLQYILKKKNEKINEIYSLTYEESAKNMRFLNEDWNDYFKIVLQEEHNEIEFKEIKLTRKFDLKRDIKAIKGIQNGSKHIIWNLTGGQRSVIFSIKSYLESVYNEMEENSASPIENTILYLEGNTQKMIAGIYLKGEGWQYEQLDEFYGDENLSLKKAFALMGYHIADKLTTIDYTSDKPETEEEFLEIIRECRNFYEKEYKVNNSVREKLISSNKQNDKQKEDLKIILEEIKFNNEIAKKISDKIGNQKNPFGYLLEYIAFGIINWEIEDKFKGKGVKSLSHNVKISHKSKTGSIAYGRDNFCEFDIVLLMQTGQMVVFECKSGTMESNNAKAREYTTYAIGGVYGKPVLITPLDKDEVKNIKHIKKSNDTYKYIYEAIGAAERANLEIYGLDEIGKKIEQLFYEMQ